MNKATRPEPPDFGTGNTKLPEPALYPQQHVQLKVSFSLSGFVAFAISRKTLSALIAAAALVCAGNLQLDSRQQLPHHTAGKAREMPKLMWPDFEL